jgi:4-hydroxy-4-methyl-2-oxoglutarate aldolase
MLENPPLLTIRREWQRPAADKLAAFKGVQTGQAADAMDGRGALDYAIKAVDPANAFFLGTAITCETGPNDNLAILAAMALAKPGDVIVAASESFTGSAVVGDNIALCAKAKGIAAIVIDGLARDVAGLLPIGLPVFARGLTPNSCVKSGPGRVGFPVAIGGVTVTCGDVILGDARPTCVRRAVPDDHVPAADPRRRQARVGWQRGCAELRGAPCAQALRRCFGQMP